MKAVYVQKGANLDYVNQSGKTIEAGEVVVFGSRIGVAGTTILAGEKGSLHMSGVFRVPKKESETIEAGADVYYTEAGCSATSPAAASAEETKAGSTKAGEAVTVIAKAASGVYAGYAVKKAEANEKEVTINLR